MKDFSAFKSGSDVRGYALGDESNPLFITDEVAMKVTFGFIRLLREILGDIELTVSVGHDSRLSADRLKNDVIKVLTSNGVTALDCGLSSTPAMFMTTVDAGCNAAVQITASHHPKDRNGLKFFTDKGGLDGSDIETILAYAGECDNPIGVKNGECRTLDFMQRYSEILRNMIIKGSNAAGGDRPLAGKKIIVDAGNGVGGFYATQVLEPLGADISGSLYLEPDGNFPNHAPNPENQQAMDCISQAVKAAGADFGVIFDTDVDRAACVGRGGFEINRNRLVALAACVALKDCPGGTVVTDSVTSDGLAKFISQHSGKHLRFKRGYRNVINKQLELTLSGVDCPLAMETSGHAAFKDNFFLDDGAYLITRLIVEMASLAKEGRELESLIDTLEEPAQECELRFTINLSDFRPAGEAVIAHFTNAAATHEGWQACNDNYEGIRINCDESCGDGWFLLRLSVHDPIIVLNCESRHIGGTKEMCRYIFTELMKADGIDSIDCSALKSFIEQ